MAAPRDYYLPEYRYTEFIGLGTIAMWNARSSNVIVITGISLSNNGDRAGTFALYWSNSSQDNSSSAPNASNGAKIMTFSVGGSATVSPNFGPIYGTIIGGTIFGAPSTSATSSYYWNATLFGYEIDSGRG